MTPFDVAAALALAVDAGLRSPCVKSKRGVVIFLPGDGVVARGWNHPPRGFACDGSELCRKHCASRCVHAEQHAITRIGRERHWRSSPLLRERPLQLLHVKVVGGAAVPSGPPSCSQCSKLIADDDRIGRVWLLHAQPDVLTPYTSSDFHRLTLEHLEGKPPCSGT